MASQINASSTNAEKIALFRALFVGREDVFARRYENVKKGTSGYSPCCRNQWGAGCVLKQHKKCSECAVRQYVPVSDEAVRWHLRGKDADMKPFVMGLYPMATDETVRLAVIDFDEASWRRDALFVVRKARELELPVALGCDSKVLKRSAGGIATRRARPIRYVVDPRPLA